MKNELVGESAEQFEKVSEGFVYDDARKLKNWQKTTGGALATCLHLIIFTRPVHSAKDLVHNVGNVVFKSKAKK